MRRQRDVGVDFVNDGELGHTMGFEYDYGAWRSYIVRRLGGIDSLSSRRGAARSRRTRWPTLRGLRAGDDARAPRLEPLRRAYADPHSGCAIPEQLLSHCSPVVRGPVTYTGQEALARDIANLKGALDAAGIEGKGWMNAVAPASCARVANEHYATDEELLYAVAEAMREEYAAIVDAGLTSSSTTPRSPEWDQSEKTSIEVYKRYTMIRITRSTTRSAGCRRSGSAFISAGAAGRAALHRPADGGPPGRDARGERRGLFVRGRERPPRARVAPVGGRKLPEGKVLMPGVVSHDERDRAPRVVADGSPASEGGRPRPHRRINRLRAGRTRAPADRLGQARSARAGRRARVQAPWP